MSKDLETIMNGIRNIMGVFVGENVEDFVRKLGRKVNTPTSKGYDVLRQVGDGYDHVYMGMEASYGLFPPSARDVLIHPMQDPSIPFIYNPVDDTYVGFRWDYGDTGPLPPVLDTNTIHSLKGLYISPSPTDYYCTHGTQWHRRFTAVVFKPGNIYRSMVDTFGANRLFTSDYDPEFDLRKDCAPQYVNYKLHPGAEPLRRAGFNSIFTPASAQVTSEMFLLDPKTQIVRTHWWEFVN